MHVRGGDGGLVVAGAAGAAGVAIAVNQVLAAGVGADRGSRRTRRGLTAEEGVS